jgi:hypothetical protein
LHVQRLTRLVLLSSSLLTIATVLPALAASPITITDTRGSVLTLTDQGRVTFTCEHGAADTAGTDSYVICTGSGTVTGGTGQSVSIISVSNPSVSPPSSFVGPLAFNQTITLQSVTYALGNTLGIATTVTWTGSTCSPLVSVKIFNRGNAEIRIKQYKRILDVNLGATADDQFAGGSSVLDVRAADPSGTILLSGGGNSGATTARAYSSVAGTDAGVCGVGTDATRDARTGDRDLVVRYDFTPGYVPLSPPNSGRGFEKFFSVRYSF